LSYFRSRQIFQLLIAKLLKIGHDYFSNLVVAAAIGKAATENRQRQYDFCVFASWNGVAGRAESPVKFAQLPD
jgi:hypothetical protein